MGSYGLRIGAEPWHHGIYLWLHPIELAALALCENWFVLRSCVCWKQTQKINIASVFISSCKINDFNVDIICCSDTYLTLVLSMRGSRWSFWMHVASYILSSKRSIMRCDSSSVAIVGNWCVHVCGHVCAHNRMVMNHAWSWIIQVLFVPFLLLKPPLPCPAGLLLRNGCWHKRKLQIMNQNKIGAEPGSNL